MKNRFLHIGLMCAVGLIWALIVDHFKLPFLVVIIGAVIIGVIFGKTIPDVRT